MNSIKLRKTYHDGEVKPKYRGILHMIISILIFLSMMIIYFKNNISFLGLIFVFSSYVISTIFHLIHFEPHIDYKVNLLDHFGIQLHGIGMQMLSSNFDPLSFSTILQTVSFIIDDLLCLYWHNYIENIFHILTFFMSFAIGFFYTFGFEAFTNSLYFSGAISYIIGGLFYLSKYPASDDYWGFHELYHLFIGFGDLIFLYDAYIFGNL